MPSDLLQCPICLDRFQEPQVLPGCGHTFCAACVRQVCETAAASGSTPSCPTCRQTFGPGEVRANFVLADLLREHAEEGSDAGSPITRASTNSFHAGGVSTGLAHLPGRLVRDPRRGGPQRACGLGLSLPLRLEQLVLHEDQLVGLRIYLLDNSGSTNAHDGKVVRADHAGSVTTLACTRWEEIKHMAMEQADWNCRIGCPCEFLLLNPGPPPLREGVGYARLDPLHGDAQRQLNVLGRMLESNFPTGATPLSQRVEEIYARVSAKHADLAAKGQRVILTVATDGLPTSLSSNKSTAEDRSLFVETLRHLMLTLPVNVVIRLCTDEDVAVQFYNEVEGELELPLDVLDDLAGEAQEIKDQGNGWFAYSPALHRLREGGTFTKLLDLLDERRLTPVEAALLAQLLLRGEDDPPFPHEPGAFCQAAAKHLRDAEDVFDPLLGRMAPPVDIFGLRVALVGGPAALVPLHSLFLGCFWSRSGCMLNHYDEENEEAFSSDDDD